MKETTRILHQNKVSCPLLDYTRLYLDLRQYVNGTSVLTIIDGTYQCPGGTTPVFITFFRHLQIPPSVSITTSTNLQSVLESCDSWKSVKENTSSHGPHIGMYKAEAQYPQLG